MRRGTGIEKMIRETGALEQSRVIERTLVSQRQPGVEISTSISMQIRETVGDTFPPPELFKSNGRKALCSIRAARQIKNRIFH